MVSIFGEPFQSKFESTLYLSVLRSRVARELMETERKYCSCLWTILDHFSMPLKELNLVAAKESMYVNYLHVYVTIIDVC